MRLELLTSERDTRKAYRELSGRLKGRAVRYFRNIGWPSGNDYFNVYWHARYQFWAMLHPTPTHYWCGYGLEDPKENRSLEFTVQINPSKNPFSRRTGGHCYKTRRADIISATTAP